MLFQVNQYYRRNDGVFYQEGDTVQLQEADIVEICLMSADGEVLWDLWDEVFTPLNTPAWHGIRNVNNKEWRILGYDRPDDWGPYDHTHPDNRWEDS